MSQENVEIVRFPVAVSTSSHRHIEERIALRFPSIVAPVARLVWRLPRRWRLRKALLRRALRFTYEAAHRGDHEAQVLLYHPDGEMVLPRQAVGLGFQPTTGGRHARAQVQRQWQEDWRDFRFEPDYAIDLGDRLLVAGSMIGSGRSSGVAVGNEWAEIFTISDGLAIREQIFFSHAEALEAAGLSE